MKFTIDSELAKNYPHLRIGVLVARDIDNRSGNAGLEELKEKAVRKLRSYTLDGIKNHPYIQSWREAYRSFGVNPKKKTPTAENLLTRVIKTGNLPEINKVVDLYLCVELEYFLPIGGYNLEDIEGDITLRYSPGGEKFIPLGGRKEGETRPGEIVYADSVKILTRRWNYKDTELAKITPSSQNIILMSEAPTPDIPTTHLENLLTALKSYIQKFCGGKIDILLVRSKESLTHSITL